MTRMVNCIKLGKEAPGLKFPPLPNDLGKRIFEHVSQEAWDAWTRHQTMLINENRLSLADPEPASIWRSRWKTTFSATAPMRLPATFPSANNTAHRQPEKIFRPRVAKIA